MTTPDKQPRKDDKFYEINIQIDKTKDVMHDNIQKIIANGENLKILEDKTEDLNENAKIFKNRSKKLHSVMWCKNMKMYGIIALIVIVIIIVFALIIYASTKK